MTSTQTNSSSPTAGENGGTQPDEVSLLQESASFWSGRVFALAKALSLALMLLSGAMLTPVIGYAVLLTLFLCYYLYHTPVSYNSSHDMTTDSVAFRVGLVPLWRCLAFDAVRAVDWFFSFFRDLLLPIHFGKLLLGKHHAFVLAWNNCRKLPTATTGNISPVFTTSSLTRARLRSATLLHPKAFSGYGKYISQMWLELVICLVWVSGGNPVEISVLALTNAAFSTPGSPLTALSVFGAVATVLGPAYARIYVGSYNPYGICVTLFALWTGFDAGFFFGRAESEAVPGKRRAWGFSGFLARMVQLISILHLILFFATSGSVFSALRGAMEQISVSALSVVQNVPSVYPWFEMSVFFCLGYSVGAPMGDYSQYAKTTYDSVVFSWKGMAVGAILCLANVITPFRNIALVPSSEWSLAVMLSGPIIVVGVLLAARKWASGSLLLRLRSSPVADYLQQASEFARGVVDENSFTIETAFPADLLMFNDDFLPWTAAYEADPNLYNFAGKTAVSGLVNGQDSYLHDNVEYAVHRTGVSYTRDKEKLNRTNLNQREVMRPTVRVGAVIASATHCGDLGGVLAGSAVRLGLAAGSLAGDHSTLAGGFGDCGLPEYIPTVFVRSNEMSSFKIAHAPMSLCIWDSDLLDHGDLVDVLANSKPGDLIATINLLAGFGLRLPVLYAADPNDPDALCRFSVTDHLALPYASGSADFHPQHKDVTFNVCRGGPIGNTLFEKVDVAYARANPPHLSCVVVGYGIGDLPFLNTSGWNYGYEGPGETFTATASIHFLQPDARGISSLQNYSAWANAEGFTPLERLSRVAALPMTAEERFFVPWFFHRLWARLYRPAISYLLTRHTPQEAAIFCILAVVCGVTIVDSALAVSYDAGAQLQDLFRFSGAGPRSVGAALLLGLRVFPSGNDATMLSALGLNTPFSLLLAVSVAYSSWAFARVRPFVAFPATAAFILLATADLSSLQVMLFTILVGSVSLAMCFFSVLRLTLFVAAVVKAANTVGQLAVSRWDRIFDFVSRAAWISASTCGSGSHSIFHVGKCECNGSSMPYTQSIAKFGLAFDRRTITFHGRGCVACRERGGLYYAFDAFGEPVSTLSASYLSRMSYMVEVGPPDDSPSSSRFNISFSSKNRLSFTKKLYFLGACSFFAFCILGGFATNQIVFVMTVAIITGSVAGGISIGYLEKRSFGSCYPLVFDVSQTNPDPNDVSALFGAPVTLASRLGEPDSSSPGDFCDVAVKTLLHLSVSILFADMFVTTVFGRYEVDATLPAGGIMLSTLLSCACSSDTHAAGVAAVVELMSKVRLPVINHIANTALALGRSVNSFAQFPNQANFETAWAECQNAALYCIRLDDRSANPLVTLGLGSVDFKIPPPLGLYNHKVCSDDLEFADKISRFSKSVPGLSVTVARRGVYSKGVNDLSLYNDTYNRFTVNTFVTVTGCAMPNPKHELPYLGVCVDERVFAKSLKPDGTPVGFQRIDQTILAGAIFATTLLRSGAGIGDGCNDVSPLEGATFVANTTNFNLGGSCTTDFGNKNRDALDNPRTWVTICQIIIKFVASSVLLMYPFEFFRKFETRVIEKDDALKDTGIFNKVNPDGSTEPCERKRSRIITIVNFAVQIFAMLLGPAFKRLLYAPRVFGFVNVYADGANPNDPEATLLNAFNRFASACRQNGTTPYWVSGDIGGWDCKMSVGLLFASFASCFATTAASVFMMNALFFAFTFSTFKCAVLGAVFLCFWGQMSSGFLLTSLLNTVGRVIMAYLSFLDNATTQAMARDRALLCINHVKKENPWLQAMDLSRCNDAQLFTLFAICTITGVLQSFARRVDYTPVLITINKGDDCAQGVPCSRVDGDYAKREHPGLYASLAGRTVKAHAGKGHNWHTLPFLLGFKSGSAALEEFGMPIHHEHAGQTIISCSMTFDMDENGVYHHSTPLEEVFGKMTVMRNMAARVDDPILATLASQKRPQVVYSNPRVFKEFYVQAMQTILAKKPTSAVLRDLMQRFDAHALRLGVTLDPTTDLNMFINNMWELPVVIRGNNFDEVVRNSGLVPGSVNDWPELSHAGLDRSSFGKMIDQMLGVPVDPKNDAVAVSSTTARALFHGGTGSGKTTSSVEFITRFAKRHDLSVVIVVPNPTVGQDIAKKIGGGFRVKENMNFYASVRLDKKGEAILHEQGAPLDAGAPGDRVANIITVSAFQSRITRMDERSLSDFAVLIDEAHILKSNFPLMAYQAVLRGAPGLALVAATHDPELASMVDQVVHCRFTSTNIKSVTDKTIKLSELDAELKRCLDPAVLPSYGKVVVVRGVGESFRKLAVNTLFNMKHKTTVACVYVVKRGNLELVRPNHRGGYVTTHSGLASVDTSMHDGQVAVVLDNSVAEGMNVRIAPGQFGTTIFFDYEKQFAYGTEVRLPSGEKTVVDSFERRVHYYRGDSQTAFHQTASRIRGDSYAIRVAFSDIPAEPAEPHYPKLAISCPDAFAASLRYLRGVDPGLFYFFVLLTSFAYKNSVAMLPDKVYIARPFLELLMSHAASPDMVEKRLNSAARVRGGRSSVPAIFEAFSGESIANLRGPKSMVVLPRLPLAPVVEDAAWHAAMQMGRLDPYNHVLLKNARDSHNPGLQQELTTRVAPCGVERYEDGRLRTIRPIFTVRPPPSRVTVSAFVNRIADTMLGGGAF